MRKLLTIGILLLATLSLKAQERHWLHPEFWQLQYAGSIGYFSAGGGYNIFQDRMRVSLQIGHVPASKGGALNILSSKLIFVPRAYVVSENVAFNPYDVGLMVSYHMGSNFRTSWPTHRYPENYYWWQTSFRFHLNYQPSVTVKLRDHTVFKTMTAYLDFNANELYLVSLFQNRHALSPADIIKLGIGMRFNL